MTEPHSGPPFTLAVDIGGTGTKVLVLDAAGAAVSRRDVRPTPRPAVPDAIVELIGQMCSAQPAFERVAVGFPGVVRHGVTITAPNLDPAWRQYPLAERLGARLGQPVRVANDADVQGFGAISGNGVELVLTLGTGLGSALFVDGILVPNLELAHHPFAEGRTYEQWLGQRALEELSEPVWKSWLNKAINMLRQTCNFDTLYIGGGNARKLNPAILDSDVRLVPNIFGLLGGIALWTGMQGTTLVRAPQSEGAYCPIDAPRNDAPRNDTPRNPPAVPTRTGH